MPGLHVCRQPIYGVNSSRGSRSTRLKAKLLPQKARYFRLVSVDEIPFHFSPAGLGGGPSTGPSSPTRFLRPLPCAPTPGLAAGRLTEPHLGCSPHLAHRSRPQVSALLSYSSSGRNAFVCAPSFARGENPTQSCSSREGKRAPAPRGNPGTRAPPVPRALIHRSATSRVANADCRCVHTRP